jgi:YidC/Oxa1 family membrane protein insertase
MDRQSTIAFLLIGIVVIAWIVMTSPTQPPPKKKAQTVQVQDTLKKQEAPAAQAQPTEQAITPDTSSVSKLFAKMNTSENIITVDNKFVRFQLTNKGGKIKRAYLKNYKNWYTDAKKKDVDVYQDNIQLLDVYRGGSFDVEITTIPDRKLISTRDLEFTPSTAQSSIVLKDHDSLSLSYEYVNVANQKITRTYTFYGDRYDTHVGVELTNLDSLSGNSYDLVWNGGIRSVEANSYDEANSSNSSIYMGGEQEKLKAPTDKPAFHGKLDWMCFRNKYFAIVIAPDQPDMIDSTKIQGYKEFKANNSVRDIYRGVISIPLKSASQKNTFLLYTGPIDYSILKKYNRNFDRIVDFGSFFGLSFIVRPIAEYLFMPLFKFLHLFIPNYGIVIIIFSFIIKLLLHPLTKQSFSSMRKMQLLQPKIAEIKEKHKDDPTKQNKETMKLYSTYGINPMGGCLPMLLQMPIFIALWGMLQSAVELRQQPFFWWITDLARPDIIAHLPFKIPIFGIDQISLLALLMGVTTFLQQKMTVTDPQQKAMVYVMPVFLTILFMNFPSGLNLYYFVFNLLSIGQQYYITHTTKGMELVPVAQNKRKPGFMSKMMEAAEEKAKGQQHKSKNKK